MGTDAGKVAGYGMMQIWRGLRKARGVRWGGLWGAIFAVGPAFGGTLYLPLNAPIASEVERLAVVSGLATMGRPYPLTRVRSEARRVTERYPVLSQRILSHLDTVYSTGLRLTHAGIELSLSDDDSPQPLPNNYGDATGRDYTLRLAWIWHDEGSVKGLAQLRLYEQDGKAELVPDLGYFALGPGWAQLDVGYRDHWFAPGRGDAPLISNNAESFPALTLSNPEPFPFLGLHYEFFVGQLQSHESIMLGTVSSPGRPYLAGMHITIAPTEWLELGATRTFMFGGGERKVNFGDFIEAFVDPAGKDNVGLGDCTGKNPDCEFGNQQMTLSGALKMEISGKPFSVYGVVGAEDTSRGSVQYLGNVLMSVGTYFPWLTPHSSLRLEYTEFEAGWYVHHIYRDGYTNDGRVLGAGWGDLQREDLGAAGRSALLQWSFSPTERVQWDVELRHVASRTDAGWSDVQLYRLMRHQWSDAVRRSGWFLNADIARAASETHWVLGGGYEW